MSRKLLQVAGFAALLVAGSLFYFLNAPTPAPSESVPISDARVPTSATTVSPPTGAKVERAASDIAESRATTPSQLLEQALSQLPGLTLDQKLRYVQTLIAQLRAAGVPGLDAAADFLRSGRDVPIRGGWSVGGGRIRQASSLRVALIDALAAWEGALPVNLEILNSHASVWETIIAIRNLESEFPGTYRVQAIGALRRRLSDLNGANFGPAGADFVFAAAAQLEATELIPLLEEFVHRKAGKAVEYVEMLNTFPEEVRQPAVDRLFESRDLRSSLASFPLQFANFSFLDERVRSAMVDIFANEMNAEQKLAMLKAFRPAGYGTPLLFAPIEKVREVEQMRSKVAVDEARSRKAFLTTARDAIALLPKEPSTPAIESAINEAQKRITDDLAKRVVEVRLESNPAVEVDFADGTGKAQIKGRRIEAIELLAPAVVQPAPSEDSTDSPDR